MGDEKESKTSKEACKKGQILTNLEGEGCGSFAL
jgi:hypothetical protein